MSQGRYYLGRVVKAGLLDQNKLIQILIDSKPITVGQYQWQFIDTQLVKYKRRNCYFSRLAKFSKEGKVPVVDTENKSHKDTYAENLLEASSPFAYIPDCSGIAYLHVWNNIDENVFRRRFKRLIEFNCNDFFATCDIEPITDYRTFVTKLQSLDKITELKAKVHPPNPLFGDLWAELNNYIETRNATEVQYLETSSKKTGLRTALVKYIKAILKGEIAKIDEPATLADASILMAADGYGSGKVIGISKQKQVVVRTSDTKMSFLHEKEPETESLIEESVSQLNKITNEREMRH
jgi:hypothetical protein